MRGGKIRKLALLVVIGGLVAALVKQLRGKPAPQFSNHPTVTGGPNRTREPDPVSVHVAAPLPVVEMDPEPVAQLEPDPETAPVPDPEPAPAPTDTAIDPVDHAPQAWVKPVDGECPEGYPIKAKVKSGIFHVPGSTTYERTKPDRCYPSVEAAEADGLRPPKR